MDCQRNKCQKEAEDEMEIVKAKSGWKKEMNSRRLEENDANGI